MVTTPRNEKVPSELHSNERNRVGKGGPTANVIRLALGALATVLLATPAHAADAATKCGAKKLIALGQFSSCRLKQTAKATRSGAPADFSTCDRALDRKFRKAAEDDGCTIPWNAAEAASTFGNCTQKAVDAAGADTLAAPGFWCPDPLGICVPICGDGIQAGNETCDDGNTVSGDGCNARCQFEGIAGTYDLWNGGPALAFEVTISPDRQEAKAFVGPATPPSDCSTGPLNFKVGSDGCTPGDDSLSCRFWFCDDDLAGPCTQEDSIFDPDAPFQASSDPGTWISNSTVLVRIPSTDAICPIPTFP
jgi:cysteine-rich repeat protein